MRCSSSRDRSTWNAHTHTHHSTIPEGMSALLAWRRRVRMLLVLLLPGLLLLLLLVRTTYT